MMQSTLPRDSRRRIHLGEQAEALADGCLLGHPGGAPREQVEYLTEGCPRGNRRRAPSRDSGGTRLRGRRGTEHATTASARSWGTPIHLVYCLLPPLHWAGDRTPQPWPRVFGTCYTGFRELMEVLEYDDTARRHALERATR